jgi:hypothetical protein
MMKRAFLLLPFVLAACVETPSGPVGEMRAAASPVAGTAGNKLQCFDGETEGFGNGVCTLTDDGATLFNAAAGDYSGVYIANSNLEGKKLNTINKLAFSYASATGDVSGGSPRITFPIDLNGDGLWDDFVSADAVGCTDGDAFSGTVDVINDPTCQVSLNGGGTYESWAAFVAAYPTATVATDAISFIIADQPGSFTITNVQLGKGPAKS